MASEREMEGVRIKAFAPSKLIKRLEKKKKKKTVKHIKAEIAYYIKSAHM